ncbi:BLUF domain-containing protein [Salegentibacter sp. Hel_I_6]|uniref:BLUF domain-containing protein n=1 Tax=Salegentibacter sp. Hel_I_6 TaxID=1250278 RepID=UPI0005682ADA|nr:BLUF domain-containing protein [Salegentibacter sp. Hel_I_6]
MFKYLVYVSRQSHVISDKDLKELLSTSRRNNREITITGILIYFQGSFIQYIEGKEENVDFLYSKIAKDQRHQSVTELDSGFNAERAFSDWSMAFKKLQNDEAASILGHQDLEQIKLFNEEEKLENHPALNLLDNYVKNL